MATIKLNAQNKILTKNGKVSCTCCGDGGGCCLYPGDGLYVGAYTGNDLPDFIEVSTIDDVFWEFGKIGIEYYNTVPVFDPSRINPNTYPPGEVRVVTFDTGDPLGPPDYKYHWVLQYREGSTWFFVDDADSDACLVREKGGWIIKDQFADTYTILDVESGQTIIVNRKSLCLWEEDNGGTRLFYNFGGPPPYNQYGAEIPRLIAWYIKDTPGRGDEGVSLPFSQQAGYGLGRLNTPVGNYGNSADDNPNSQIVFTVS